MPKRKLSKKGLIKKGASHPVYPSYKFHSAHLKAKDADKAEDKLLETPQEVDATRRIHVPSQYLVYKHPVRITPKRPRLRK